MKKRIIAACLAVLSFVTITTNTVLAETVEANDTTKTVTYSTDSDNDPKPW